MKKITLLIIPILAAVLPAFGQIKEVRDTNYPGVWSFTFGTPEKITPMSTRSFEPDAAALAAMAAVKKCPVQPTAEITDRGVLIRIPLKADELIYGLGLQMQSFQQRGSKKMLRVNADPEVNSGDSHAPVPFYVTTSGYGIFVDNARYMTFYLGNRKRKPEAADPEIVARKSEDGWNALNGPYERLGLGIDTEVIIEIPRAEGTRVIVFGGPTMKDAVARYNLYSGGGTLAPRWGLGFWYRVHSDYTQAQVLALADTFRERNIPCDVLGLEPHWQTNSYSSSYIWSAKFTDPKAMVGELRNKNYRLNMWQQAFVHPKSPIYTPLLKYSGDYEVWDGVVPDFMTPEARQIFGDHMSKIAVDYGVSGFKADECDNADFSGFWSFPEMSRFPSGADGEQMHMLFGLRYQDAVLEMFRRKNERTYGLVRNSGAFAAPYPFVLYSDLYNHRTFINTIAQSSFSGLLWTPEVRHAASDEDLIRRMQAVILSPLAMVNAWYLQSPPWMQLDRALNNKGVFVENWEKTEAACREIIDLRMMLVPYIHSAFVKYKKQGVPPFRALILDYPDDPATTGLNSQYMMGDDMMCAPVAAGEKSKNIYFPEGVWYDFFTGQKYEGGRSATVDVPINRIPLFVKQGALLPLAKVTNSTSDPESGKLTVKVYGKKPASFTLFADDGSDNPSLATTTITWDGKTVRTEGRKDFYSIEKTVEID